MEMKSLGLLKNLNVYDSFTFNGMFFYSIIAKNNNIISYQRISKGQKGKGQMAIEWNKQHAKNNPLNPYVKEYSIDGNIEVFDFFPF